MRQHTTWSTLSAARRKWSAVTSVLFSPFFCLFNGQPSHDTSLYSTCGDVNGLASFKTSWKNILAFLKKITSECEPSDSLCGFKRCTASATHFPTQQNQEKKASNDPEQHCAIHDHWCLHTLAGQMHTLACCFCSRPTSTSDSCCVFLSEPVD